MNNNVESNWPSYSGEETEAVAKVLLSNQVNYWTGNECRWFEKEFAEWTGVRKAIALANGTLALDAALSALRIGPGDEVVVTSRSFIASVSAVALAGATPVFADVDCDSQNLDAETIAPVVTNRTRAVLPVHLAGWPCDMDGILELANACGMAVIEDCAQAHGAKYKGKSVGTFGSVGTWSFCQDKILTAGGEGGMVTTNDEELWAEMWSRKDHGKSTTVLQSTGASNTFQWVHESFGSNWRLTEMQAAIGRVQLRKLPEWHRQRTQNALQLSHACSGCEGLRVPMPPQGYEHAWYKFYVFVIPEALRAGWSRDRILSDINAAGVPCFTGSCPEIYLEKAFDDTGWRPAKRLTVARRLGETSLMFLVHPTLTQSEIERTCHAVQRAMRKATR